MRGDDGQGITLSALLLAPYCDNVLPRLVSSSPPRPPVPSHPSFSFSCLLFLFLDSRGEATRRGERRIARKYVREHFLPVARIEPSVSLSVPQCPSVLSLRRLSSSPSVSLSKCLFSPALFPLSSFTERNSGGRV